MLRVIKDNLFETPTSMSTKMRIVVHLTPQQHNKDLR